MKQNPPRKMQVIDGPLPEEDAVAPVLRYVPPSPPARAARVSFQFCGMTVQKAFSRRPRVQRLEVSRFRRAA